MEHESGRGRQSGSDRSPSAAARSEASGPHAPPKSVAGRVLSVLGAFDAENYAMSLSDIARRTGLPVATCHRLIKELVDWGALVQVSGRYRIGHRLWSLGLLSPVRRDLAEIAAPFMHDVLFRTEHVVNLFVLDGTEALLLERISGTRPGPAVSREGARMALHATAAGKVMLAHAPRETVEIALEHLERFTPHTIISRAQLLEEVELVRQRGFATTSQESAMGTSGVAVPVTSIDGQVIAALGIVIVGAQPRETAIVSVLQAAARGIAKRVGYIYGGGQP